MWRSMFLPLPYKLLSVIFLSCFVAAVGIAEESSIATPDNLPMPISNNAVASLTREGIDYIASFNGLTASKKAQDITSKAFLWRSDTERWQQLPRVPGGGKLASSAVAINDTFYVIGGYTIAADGSEISTPEIYRLGYPYQEFRLETLMPVAVDDSVAVVYKNRYLYLISGWHNQGNVPDVQIYDTKAKQWYIASEFPGIPVFGHTAVLSRNKILLVDGVGVVGKIDGKRQFAGIKQAWIGDIDETQITTIHWRKISHHPGKARYRMAAFEESDKGNIVFLGGSDNPYNYNGIGYDMVPSKPVEKLLIYNIKLGCWFSESLQGPAIMDLRGSVDYKKAIFIIGGMGDRQNVLSKVTKISVNNSLLNSLLDGCATEKAMDK